MQIAEKQRRYLTDSVQVRLGGLAANLARVESFSDNEEHRDVVLELIEESKYFIEWSAPEVALPFQAELVHYQLTLALWQKQWHDLWSDPVKRITMMQTVGEWAQRILHESGLLKPS